MLLVQIVERVAYVDARRDHVGDHDPTARPAHPRHLGQRERRDRGSGAVSYGTRRGRTSRRRTAARSRRPPATARCGARPSCSRAEPAASNAGVMSTPTTWRTNGAACSDAWPAPHATSSTIIVFVEGLDPRERRGEAAGERRVFAREQADLLGERIAHGVVVFCLVRGHTSTVTVSAVTVSARSAKDRPVAARSSGAPELGFIDMRDGRTGTGRDVLLRGRRPRDGLALARHASDRIRVRGHRRSRDRVDSSSPAAATGGVDSRPASTHCTTLQRVRSVAVFFDPAMVRGADDRVRVLAATPLLREMIVFAARWPITRPESDPVADAYFDALAALVREWLEHEAPLSLPTSSDPIVRGRDAVHRREPRRRSRRVRCARASASPNAACAGSSSPRPA